MSGQEWISTGKAAKLMGYNPDWFVKKFEGIIPMQRRPGGHRRWLASAVEILVSEGQKLPEAG